MKLKASWFLILVVVGALLCGPASAQTKQVSKNFDLAAPEKDVLSEINELRAHPEKYVSYLESLKPFFKDKAFQPTGHLLLTTEEGWSAVEDAITFLRTTKPQPPLSLSRGLCLAASTHVKDQTGSGATGHKGSDSG